MGKKHAAPLSLYPLTFDEALDAIARVKPEPRKPKVKTTRRREKRAVQTRQS